MAQTKESAIWSNLIKFDQNEAKFDQIWSDLIKFGGFRINTQIKSIFLENEKYWFILACL